MDAAVVLTVMLCMYARANLSVHEAALPDGTFYNFRSMPSVDRSFLNYINLIDRRVYETLKLRNVRPGVEKSTVYFRGRKPIVATDKQACNRPT